MFSRYGVLITGLVLLAIGLFTGNKDEVPCNGKVMQAGDVCVHRKGFTANTLDEERKEQDTSRILFTAAGSALTIAGAAWIVVSLVRRRNSPDRGGRTS
jgi:hypothetical protein